MSVLARPLGVGEGVWCGVGDGNGWGAHGQAGVSAGKVACDGGPPGSGTCCGSAMLALGGTAAAEAERVLLEGDGRRRRRWEVRCLRAAMAAVALTRGASP